MAVLRKLCLFIHIRSFIMILSTTDFTFIFPFEAQRCCAWTIVRTNNMSCFTLLRLLDVCKWILVYILFLVIDIVSKVKKLHTKYLLAKRMDLLLLLCSFLVFFIWVCIVLLFVIVFLLSTCSFLVCCLGFQFFFVYVNISLQQCIISCSFNPFFLFM
jgi:hypothetical protein